MSSTIGNSGPRKVLLLRADSTSSNLGVRVLAAGMTALAQRAWGEDTVVHVQNYDGGDTGVAFNKGAVLKDVFSPNGPIKSTLSGYDAVIDVGGGDSFTDIYGLKRLALLLYTQSASQRLGVPTILAPQTIGPFTRSWTRYLAGRSLRGMALVLARDNASEKEAASLGRAADLSATDVVFALPVPVAEKTRGVVINPSGLLWRGNHHVDSEQYQSSTRALIASLLERGHEVSLMPHVLDSPNADNDVPVVKELASEFPSVRVEAPESLDDVRRIVASASLLVGARMHACLNAVSVGTPAIPWAYSRKFAPLLGDIGWPFVVDLRESRRPVEETCAILDSEGLEQLTVKAAAVRQRAEDRLDLVVSALSSLSLERTR